MAYTGRSRATIRDSILATWSAEYTSIGLRLLVAPGSDAYLWATAMAVELEGLEAQAESVERDILPDQASPTALARHGYVDGVARRPGVVARHTVTVSAGSNATFTIPTGTLMAYSDGTLYTVGDPRVTTSGGGHTGTLLNVASVDPGSAVTRAVGDVLTFVSTPTGLNPTGTVATVAQPGTGEESVSSWASRIIAQRRERPASGNRSQWQDWVEGFEGTTIARAYVYPLLEPPAAYPGAGVANTLGCVTVVAVGPAQGTLIAHTRIVPTDDASSRTAGAELARIEDYIEGDRTITGATTTTGTQLRPVSLAPGNYSVEAITEDSRDVVIQITNNIANPFPWTGSVAISSSTTTTIVAAGDHTAINGLPTIVYIGVGYYRGATVRAVMPVGVFAAGNTTWTFSTPFGSAPYGTLYPCPPNWAAIQTAVFAYFDALGPGDTSPASRWPPESSEARSTLYRTALASAVLASTVTVSPQGALVSTPSDVLSAVVTTPGADVTPAQKTVVTLGAFRVVA